MSSNATAGSKHRTIHSSDTSMLHQEVAHKDNSCANSNN